jgi:PhnB protein
MHVQSYLFFNGRCEEAVAFYRKALGAQVEMTVRFNEAPDPPPPGMLKPGSENKIMHTQFKVGDTTIMASDGGCDGNPKFEGFSLSIAVTDAAAADRMFDALADGGQVRMPMDKTFWSERFGMVQDRFGVGWMINVGP